MIRPRTAIVLAAGLFGLYILNSVWQSLAPPQSSRTGVDSYGTGRLGFRGLVELVERLGTDVRRELDPPGGELAAGTTYVLLDPDPLLVRTDPAHLKKLAAWVRQGGRLVVSPAFPDAMEQAQIESYAEELEHFDVDLLEQLGLAGVRVELILSSAVPEESLDDDDELVISRVAESSTGEANANVSQLVTLGSALPAITADDATVFHWQTRTLDANGKEIIAAAAIELGAGEVIVIADSTLLCNTCLRRGDNAPWSVALLSNGGRDQLVFGEFYHGHGVRGNAWWLLTFPQYALLALSGLTLLGLWTWRQGVLLGPSLAPAQRSRRGIGEYIDAMSRFFLRSRKSPPFLLEQVRSGVWHRLCHEFALPPATPDAERLFAAMERRSSARAQQARTAFAAAKDLTAGNTHASPATYLRAMRDLSQLLAHGEPVNFTRET